MAQSGNKSGGLLSGFGDFIMRGNVVDLAVAVIIGGAFGKIVESFVADIVTPLILNPALKSAGVDKISELSAGGIQYGLFLASILNFLVIAFSIYLMVQAFESAKRKAQRKEALAEAEAADTPAPPDPAIVAQESLTTAITKLTQVMESK
jgi:large conductance mechanosensitive channel